MPSRVSRHTKMNLLAVISLCLTFTDAAGNLDISDIRLVNGSGPYGGRVEIQINGVWGTVCDDSFDFNDATVMCRMMNLKASTYITGAWYGQGIGPIFALEFKCRGNETHLKNCPYDSNTLCTHAGNIGIICSECPKIGISNGSATDISAEGTVLSAKCYIGFASNTLTSTCSNGMWSPPSISCTCVFDITDIRLVNGIGLYDGRVELLVNGTWGTICGTSFSWNEATAICRILFGSNQGYRTYLRTSRMYGPGEGPIYIDKLDCDRSSTSICQCSHSLDVSCTDHTQDIAVACNVRPLNVTATRLVNGTGPYDGRIELLVDGHWGTICNRYIDMYSAQTLCTMLNSRLAVYFTKAVYGKGTGPVLNDYINCPRDSDHIKYCKVYQPYRSSCTHDYDLSIVCIFCGQPEIYNGEVFSFNITELTVKCHEGFFPDYIKMRCLDNGTWIEDQRCTSFNEISIWDTGFFTYNGSMIYADCNYYKTYIGTLTFTYNNDTQTWQIEGECQEYSYPLYISDIRLADGPKPSQGRVEMKSLDTYGTICDNNFGISEANLICNMAGYTRAASFHTRAFYGEGKGPIFVDELDCRDNATDFNDCTYNTFDMCTHADDISVTCTVSDCGDPTPRNGFVNTSSTTYQTVVHVACDNGYRLIGEDDISCQSNGTWSNLPGCKLIDCGDPTPRNGFVSTSSTTYQTVVHVACDNGYRLIGEDDISCQTSGAWSNLPVCKLIDCGDPTPVHGSSNSSVTTNGSVARIECETGYTLTGKSNINCQPDETWSDTPSCIIADAAVNENTETIIISLGVCMALLLVTNLGLLLVIVRLKRNANSKAVKESTTAAGTAAETDQNDDTPSNIYETCTGRCSETNLYEDLEEQANQQISMSQLDYVILKPNEHKQKLGRHSMQTEEEHCYQNFNMLNKN